MGDAGSPYVRFRRSLETGNPHLVIAAARELPQVALDDALRTCLVLRDGDCDRYELAAVRWLGRFALETVALRLPSFGLLQAPLTGFPISHPKRWSNCRLCLARGVG